ADRLPRRWFLGGDARECRPHPARDRDGGAVGARLAGTQPLRRFDGDRMGRGVRRGCPLPSRPADRGIGGGRERGSALRRQSQRGRMSTPQMHAERIAAELNLRPGQVRAALELFAAGNTIPFGARYRKEATGELDEVQLRDLRDRNEYLIELDSRRATILASIEEQGKLDDALRARLEAAGSKSELEDLYR